MRQSPAGLFVFYSRCQFCQFASGSLPCGAVNDASRLLRPLTFLSRPLTFFSLQLGGVTVWFIFGTAEKIS